MQNMQTKIAEFMEAKPIISEFDTIFRQYMVSEKRSFAVDTSLPFNALKKLSLVQKSIFSSSLILLQYLTLDLGC